MIARTLTALVTVTLWTALAGAQEAPDERACCLEPPVLECSITSSLAACLEGPGVPVPGTACCALREVVDLGCFDTPCYTGPDGSAGVGACMAGAWACSPDGAIACAGEVTPAAETCNGIDDDCDGIVDEGFDADGDGFASCQGDCDDTDPSVNPGAIEVCDGIDNNCDGITDGETPDCQSGPNASATCNSGTCQQTCDAGFADCDGLAGNGCEAALSTDPNHCGSCNTFCGGTCSAGACVP